MCSYLPQKTGQVNGDDILALFAPGTEGWAGRQVVVSHQLFEGSAPRYGGVVTHWRNWRNCVTVHSPPTHLQVAVAIGLEPFGKR